LQCRPLKRQIDEEAKRFRGSEQARLGNTRPVGSVRSETLGKASRRNVCVRTRKGSRRFDRATDVELREYYMKGVAKLTFLSTEATAPLKDRMGQLEQENKDMRARLEKLEAISVERLALAAGSKKRKKRAKRVSFR